MPQDENRGRGAEKVGVCSTPGQDRKYDLLYLARDFNGFTLIAGQHLGGVAGIANLHAKRS